MRFRFTRRGRGVKDNEGRGRRGGGSGASLACPGPGAHERPARSGTLQKRERKNTTAHRHCRNNQAVSLKNYSVPGHGPGKGVRARGGRSGGKGGNKTT